MATVDEILAAMSEEDVTLTATDEMLVIDPDTRQINVSGVELVFGVTSDTQSERKYFLCPRYVGNDLDLASCFIRVNFRNANGEVDAYLVDDVTATGDNVTFSWVLSRKVTKYQGQVRFVVCATLPGGAGMKPREWHTTQASGIVLEGIEPDAEAIESGTADAVAQLLELVNAQSTEVENVGEAQVSAVQTEGATQINAVKTAAKTAEIAAVAEIEAKGVNTLASIPEDYTALEGVVDGLTRSTAPGIVCEVAGSAVVVNDASNQAMRGLRIFGRSTQDGTPTPDAPVEIVSVDKPVVTVCGKNLVKNGAKSETLKGVTFTVNEDGSFTAKGTSTGEIYYGIDFAVENVFPGVRYRLSGCPAGGSASTYRLYTQTSDGKNFAGDVGMGTSFTGTSDQWQVLFVIYGGATVDFTVRPMLRLASIEDSTYEPYSGQRVELTHTLPGIPVASGGNYTDSDGQQWVCDEVDLERGVYVQRCNVVEFDGTNHSFYTGQHTNGQLYIGISDFDIERNSRVISSHYKSAVWSNNNGEVYCSNDVVIVTDNRFASVSEAKRYFGETPVVFIYALEIPIETPLPETEIAAYRALHTNKPNTTVLNDSGAHMVVAYTADTKLYIDNKIAAMMGG